MMIVMVNDDVDNDGYNSEGDVIMVMVMMSMMCCVCFSRKSTGSILLILGSSLRPWHLLAE